MSDSTHNGTGVNARRDSISDHSSEDDTSPYTSIPDSTPTAIARTTPATPTVSPSPATMPGVDTESISQPRSPAASLIETDDAAQTANSDQLLPVAPSTGQVAAANPPRHDTDLAIPGGYPSERTSGHETSTVTGSQPITMGSSRLRRFGRRRPVRARLRRLTKHRSPFKALSDHMTDISRTKLERYKREWNEVTDGLEKCWKERNDLLDRAISRQRTVSEGTDGPGLTSKRDGAWSQQQTLEIEDDVTQWKTNTAAFDRYRADEARAARKVRYKRDGIKLVEHSSRYPETKTIDYRRSLADECFDEAYTSLSSGPLDAHSFDVADTQVKVGRLWADLEQRATESRAEKWAADCLAAGEYQRALQA